MGISKVDWILHTHHHRDQCQGDPRAVEREIPIAVPAHERNLFADAENFWRNRRVFHLYYVRNDFNTITRNIPVERPLADYSTFRWNKTEFFVLPTPGHTLGSITLLANVDGKQVAFSGDLMYAPGKIQNLYDTQVNYGGAEGIDLGIYSLARLREQKPELLCPSHGEPIANPDAAIGETIGRLTDYYRFQTGAIRSEFRRPYRGEPAPGGAPPHHVVVLRHRQRQRQGPVHRLRLGLGHALRQLRARRRRRRPHPLRRAQHRPAEAGVRPEVRGRGHAQPHARRPHERLSAPDAALWHAASGATRTWWTSSRTRAATTWAASWASR